MSDSDTLVRVEHVSKKFCKSLKRSLWYGLRDTFHELNPFAPAQPENEATDGEFRLPALREHEFWAVQDVSFELKRGECLGLIGHNGAGKSTLLKMLNGLIKPDTGRIEMRGRVGALIELGAGFNPILTGRENIYNKGAVLGFTKREIDGKFDAIVDFAEIGDFLDMPVQNYSSGMKVRLGFAVSAQMDPDVLIIDEVLAVGDMAFRMKCYSRMAELLRSSAVLFVSHSMPQIANICSSSLFMRRGLAVDAGPGGVTEAVERYLSESSTSNDGEREVLFSRGAQVTSLEIRSGGDCIGFRERIEVRHGDPVEIRVGVVCAERALDATLRIGIWNAEMRPVIHILGDRFGLDTGKLLVQTLRVPSLELGSGLYYLNTSICCGEHAEIIFMEYRSAEIVVKGSVATGGTVVIHPVTETCVDSVVCSGDAQ